MELKEVTLDNIEQEHICCTIAEKKGETGISSKKAWLKERMSEGLKFVKLDVRGKVFIEYLPSENAWCPLDAKNYMYIDCFWVSGQYKGQGYANRLLDYCIADAKQQGKLGLVVLSSEKKRAYLSEPKFLKYKGFQVADQTKPDFELLYLPFNKEAPVPKFKPCVNNNQDNHDGFVIYYTHQCPFTTKYVPLLEEIALKKGFTIQIIHVNTKEKAQSMPSPTTTYALFYNGKFITNEILSEKSFDKMLLKHKISNL